MFLIISMYNITKIYIYYYKNENILNKVSFYIYILLFEIIISKTYGSKHPD